MEITTTAYRKQFAPVGAFIQRHVLLIALIIGLLWNAISLWESWTQYADKVLAGNSISAKQLRVNESQRLQLIKRLQSYHQPTAATSVPPITYQGDTTGQ